jgi:large subunit ribosomal protein L9
VKDWGGKIKIMEIILIKDVDNLGARNEVVKVKNGYARNYLLPRQLAVENSPSNRKQLEERMKQVKKKEDKMLPKSTALLLTNGLLQIRC